MKVPRYERSSPFTGTGDLFSALMIGWISQGYDLVTACEKTVNSIQSVISNTIKNQKSTELQLIQSKKEIENPSIIFKAEIIKKT